MDTLMQQNYVKMEINFQQIEMKINNLNNQNYNYFQIQEFLYLNFLLPFKVEIINKILKTLEEHMFIHY